MITYLKRQRPPPTVSIRFLTTLGCNKPPTDKLNFLRRLPNQLRTQQRCITHLGPTNWRPTRSAIQGLKRCHTDARLKTVVVGKLYQWQVPLPRPTEVQDTTPKHILEDLNSTLGLPVSLRMISRTKGQLSAQGTLQTLPQPSSKTRISI